MLENCFQYDLPEAGCDEAGRGCLAGPVFAAAVMLPPDFHDPLLNDSKQMTERNREKLRTIIEREAVAWAVEAVSAERIDEINILNASFEGMSLAAARLDPAPGFLAIDGNRFRTRLELPYRCIVKGDGKYADIAAASVLAKTHVPARILPAAPAPSLTENPVFQGFVLLLAATYAILLYRNLGDIRLLLTRVSHDTATGKRLMEDPGGSGFSHFLNVATAIGILFVGVMTVKYGDSLIPDSLIETLPQGAVLALSLLATFACLCVGIFQRGVVRLAGAVTLSQPFVSQLMLLKRTYFTLGVIVTVPALLLFALCPRGTGDVWFCIIVIELLATVFLYLRETLNLFLSKKISILHWILYLCTVEIFPISLIGLLAAR